jgi:hypothetical protein
MHTSLRTNATLLLRCCGLLAVVFILEKVLLNAQAASVRLGPLVQSVTLTADVSSRLDLTFEASTNGTASLRLCNLSEAYQHSWLDFTAESFDVGSGTHVVAANALVQSECKCELDERYISSSFAEDTNKSCSKISTLSGLHITLLCAFLSLWNRYRTIQ